MPDGPKAVCWMCGARYGGWSLAQRKRCDCGGTLVIDPQINVIIGYVNADRRNGSKIRDHHPSQPEIHK
ncbi:hypothetical protein ES703_00683 [subsurface metagenome]